jgi:hypothetical protein
MTLTGIGVALAGCGGGSKGSSQTIKAASFETQVERICTARHALARAPTGEYELPSLAEIAQERARTAQELAVLRPPTALMSGYRRLVVLIAHEAVLYRRLKRYLREENSAGVQVTHGELRYHNKVARQARLLGLAKCV